MLKKHNFFLQLPQNSDSTTQACLECQYDLPNSKKEIIELEKTLRKAARMMKGTDQLYKSSTIRDVNAKMQKQPPAQDVLKSLLPASREAGTGKGCSVRRLFVHSSFEQPAATTDGPCLTVSLN